MDNKKQAKVTITSVSPIKSGTATSKKTGKPFTWTISTVNAVNIATGNTATFTTFDDFTGKEGQDLDVSIWQEDYNGKPQWKMELPKRNVWQEINDLKARLSAVETALQSVHINERVGQKVGLPNATSAKDEELEEQQYPDF